MKVVELLNCIEPWDKGRDNYRYFVPKFIEDTPKYDEIMVLTDFLNNYTIK